MVVGGDSRLFSVLEGHLAAIYGTCSFRVARGSVQINRASSPQHDLIRRIFDAIITNMIINEYKRI